MESQGSNPPCLSWPSLMSGRMELQLGRIGREGRSIDAYIIISRESLSGFNAVEFGGIQFASRRTKLLVA